MERVPDIVIICPACKGMAAYYANGQHTYNGHIVPAREGKAICSHCGHNAAFTFTSNDYFYKIPVGKRMLYARTEQHLFFLRDYFKEYKKITEPGFDFPKSFYIKRADIIRKIEQIVC